MVDSIAPAFLVAVPQLLDPNFHQSVVLMLEQNDEGAMGVVINRESPLLLSELCDNHEIPYAGDPLKKVRVGGPVQPEQGLVIYSAEHQDPEGREVESGLHASASTGTLTRLCSEAGARFHCYTGYAGWAPGQLETEINEGSWIVTPINAASVLDCPPEEIWKRVLTENGFDPGAITAGGGAEA
jgi:putative transcriptional regulator